MYQKVFLVAILLYVLLMLFSCTGYKVSDNGVSYVTLDEARGLFAHPIQLADRSSFNVLSNNHAKDKANVYYKMYLIEGADPDSFISISDTFSKDTKNVYIRHYRIEGADPKTFQPINGDWGKDANDIYMQTKKINACDKDTFEFLTDFWQKDSLCVYKNGRKLAGADPNTFQVISFSYAKDARLVFSGTFAIPIEGADARSFHLDPEHCVVCGRDKKRCYRSDKVVTCENN